MQVCRFYHLSCFLMSHDDQETSKKVVLNQIEQEDKFQEEEIVELALKDIGLI